MESAPHPRKKIVVYCIGIIAALAGLLFGLDVGVISGAQSFIEKEFGVSDQLMELIVSSLLWGATFGALISSFFSRRFGRRKTILFSAVIFIVGSIACAIAHNAESLIAYRFFLGIAVGLASFTAPLYLSEISPQNVRGGMISMYQLMITIGIVAAFLSNTWFASYADIGGVVGGHWRWMLGVIAIPAAVMFLGVFFLPESPRWLCLNNLRERAVTVLKGLHLSDAEIASEIAEIEDSLKVKSKGWQLFLENPNFRRAIFLGISLQIIQQLTGINVIMYYAPRIFEIAGFGDVTQQMWGTVIVGMTNVLATFIAIAFVDKIGRKPIMYAGFVTMGLAMVTVGIIFNVGVEGHQELAYPAIAALLVFIIGFAMSAGPIIWILCSEIYPLAGRDFGVMCSTGTNWIVNAIVGGTFLTLLGTLGSGNTFLLYGGLNVIFIIVFLLFVPETKGISLERIEKNLLSGLPLKKIGR